MLVDDRIGDLYSWLQSLARKYEYNPMDAEDLAGETILKILQHRDSFDNKKPLKPWCEAIMSNTYITSYNRGKCIEFVHYDVPDIFVTNYQTDTLYSFRQTLNIIRKAGRKSQSIECVIMYAKGYSYEEISAAMHIPIGTVRSRISYGRKLLMSLLEFKVK